MSNLKIGIIGVGHLGKLHLKILNEICKENASVTISGIYDIDTEKMNEAASAESVNIFTDPAELIANSDAVIIVTPTSTHYEIASKIIDQGKHLFIEKPVTETIDEAKKLIELASGKGLKIQIGHIERFNPAVLAIEKYNIDPLFIETHRLATFNPRGTDVSVIQDLMIHDIDIILDLVRSPVDKIDANGVAIITDKIDIANARISFENGCVANVTASRISQAKMRKMRIFQKSAYISIDFQKNVSEIFRLMSDEDIKSSKLIPGEFGEFPLMDDKKIVYELAADEEVNPLKCELESFIDTIKNDTQPIVTLEDGTRALIVATQIIQAVESSSKKMNI